MRILVTTASKHGSTDEIGARIGSVLGARGHRVELRKTCDVGSIEPYDVVILGSALYAGRWQRDAKALVERQRADLSPRPVWLFSSGPVGDPSKPKDDPIDVVAVQREVGALDHHVFSGKIDTTTLSLPERAVVKALHVEAGDYRDWCDVERWAGSIADSLSSG
jgi:menaquinone-dependent protoporphyrinogen oxidase